MHESGQSIIHRVESDFYYGSLTEGAHLHVIYCLQGGIWMLPVVS